MKNNAARATGTFTMNKSYSHDSFLYGVVYYPEQWPEFQWDLDLSRIVDTGMNALGWSRARATAYLKDNTVDGIPALDSPAAYASSNVGWPATRRSSSPPP